jgi:hypothetical protein
MKIEIPLIPLDDQRKFIRKAAIDEAIAQLQANLDAPVYPPQTEVDESQETAHLRLENEDWQAPSPDLVAAFFRQFQLHFPEYHTDQKLADLLGVSSNRRIRAFKSGDKKVPYGVWRRFLVMTGRVPQEIVPVLGYLG